MMDIVRKLVIATIIELALLTWFIVSKNILVMCFAGMLMVALAYGYAIYSSNKNYIF